MALQTIEQFGQSVKAKYPQYSNIPDAELGTKTLEKYPVYRSKVAPAAPPAMSADRAADQESAQSHGAFIPANTESGGAFGEAVKSVLNIPKSAFNFAKGAIDMLNPVSSVNKVKQAGVEAGGLMQDIAGVKKSEGQNADLTKQLVAKYQTKKAAGEDVSHLENYFKENKIDINKAPATPGAFSQFPGITAAKTVAKVLPKTGYETIIPEAARGLVTGVGGMITGDADKEKAGFDTAHRSLVNDPVGSIAPFLLAAKGGAKIADRVATKNQMGNYVKNIDTNIQNRVPIPTKPVTKYSDAFNTGVSKTAAPVINTVRRVAGGTRDFITGGTKFAAGQATGLQPETISQVIEKPGAFTKEARASVDRASLGQEVQSALGTKSAALSETGAAYKPIREGGVKVKVAPNWIDSTIKDLTGLEIKKGQLKTSGSAVLRDAPDVRAMQHLYDLWKPVFKKGVMTADEFLNFRTDLAKISKFERQIGKSQPLESMAKITRGRFNEAYRPQLEGLDKLDTEFSTQNAELAKLSKGFVDKNGNLTDSAMNKIANATGKGKDLLLSRLEETVPGITQKIKVLKAVEDIQNASGIKVGTYGRAAITGGAFFAGGPIMAAVTAILTSPEMAVPILRRYGLIKNHSAVQAVIQALKTGAKTVNELPNNPPAVLNKDVREIKAPAGLSIQDVSGGKPSAFSPKAQGAKSAPKVETPPFKSAIEAMNSPKMKAFFDELNAKRKSSQVTKTSNNLYHTTSAENLASITKNGLQTGQKARFEGVSSPSKISFSANEVGANYYGKQGDIMIRTKTSYKPTDLEHDLLAGGEGAYTTKTNIPPDMLEVKQGNKWVPLSELKKQAGAFSEKVSPIIQEAKKYKSFDEFEKSLDILYSDSPWRGNKHIDADRLLKVFDGYKFHGSNAVDAIKKTGFKDRGNYYNSGVYFADTPDVAISYSGQNRSHGGSTQGVFAADLKNLKIKEISYDQFREINKGYGGEELVAKLKNQKYDGIHEPGGETLVWNAGKIKNPKTLKDIWEEANPKKTGN